MASSNITTAISTLKKKKKWRCLAVINSLPMRRITRSSVFRAGNNNNNNNNNNNIY